MTELNNKLIADALTSTSVQEPARVYKFKQVPCKGCNKAFERLTKSLNCRSCANSQAKYLKSLRNARYYSKKTGKVDKSISPILVDQKIDVLIKVKKELDDLLTGLIANRDVDVLPFLHGQSQTLDHNHI